MIHKGLFARLLDLSEYDMALYGTVSLCHMVHDGMKIVKRNVFYVPEIMSTHGQASGKIKYNDIVTDAGEPVYTLFSMLIIFIAV